MRLPASPASEAFLHRRQKRHSYAHRALLGACSLQDAPEVAPEAATEMAAGEGAGTKYQEQAEQAAAGQEGSEVAAPESGA